MRNFINFVGLATTLGATPLQAAPDAGLVLHNTGIGERQTGVGARVGIRIALGSDRVVENSDRVTLGISAGPIMILPDRASHNGVRRTETSFVDFDVRPGYSASLKFGGKPVATNYTLLGAAEKDNESEDKQSTGDKIAWVAAVAGGVMVFLIGAVVVHCGQQEGNRCSE